MSPRNAQHPAVPVELGIDAAVRSNTVQGPSLSPGHTRQMEDTMPTDRSLERLMNHVDALSDRDLVTHAMDVLTSPPVAEADSFVLHAPLELMARAELLPSVVPSQRNEARQRIVEIASDWASRNPHEPTPTGPSTITLPDAVAAGDPDAADRALVELAATHTIDEFVAIAGDALLDHLGGAGHLAIFLDQLARRHRPPRWTVTAGRALVRDLARHPAWTIEWIDAERPRVGRPSRNFFDVLADPPSADPGSNFIYPTMHLVDANGMAAELLSVPTRSLPTDEARRQLLRIAALSMLQDDPTNAPYGWSHCLTMPQATLAVAPRTADPQRAVAIAATYVLGFRATQSNTALDPDWQPPHIGRGRPLLESDGAEAVALAWHTDDPSGVERELATYAATHPDAHLAKYTLACLHAAHSDPEAAALFRAAAAHLAVWWRDIDTPDSTEDDQHDD